MGKPEEWNEFETYDDEEEQPKKKEGFLTKLWNKTVFPDKIKRAKEEKRIKEEIAHEAKMEAMAEMKDQLKEKYKQDEIDRLTGKKRKDMLQKLADGFKMDGGGLGSTDKINQMLGTGRQTGVSNQDIAGMMGSGSGMSNDQIQHEVAPRKKVVKKKKTTKKKPQPTYEQKEDEWENKIKRMLG